MKLPSSLYFLLKTGPTFCLADKFESVKLVTEEIYLDLLFKDRPKIPLFIYHWDI